jgi:hypothetical protein
MESLEQEIVTRKLIKSSIVVCPLGHAKHRQYPTRFTSIKSNESLIGESVSEINDRTSTAALQGAPTPPSFPAADITLSLSETIGVAAMFIRQASAGRYSIRESMTRMQGTT